MTPRSKLASLVAGKETIFSPLALDALTGRIAERAGFQSCYVSGGALGYAHALSEALLTVSELADTTRHITQRTSLAVIVDGGVGFGDAVHTARTVWEIEATGAAAIEIEDQVAPKRVSHHRGIEHLITIEDMVSKIEVACAARTDPDFLIIARTGACRNESFDAAVERCTAYGLAGADLVMLMPVEEEDWARAPVEIKTPLAAIQPLSSRPPEEWENLGWRLIIDPFTAQVLAVDAIQDAYNRFKKDRHSHSEFPDLMSSYKKLPELAGLIPLYEIEDNTTEKE